MFSPRSTGYVWSEHSFSIILILYTEPVNQRASSKYFTVEAYYLDCNIISCVKYSLLHCI